MSSPTPPLGPARHLGVAVALVTAMTVGTAVQFATPILGPLLLPDLGLTRAQLGSLTSVFFAVGAVASPLAGRLADRTSDRTAMAVTFLLGGISLAAMSRSPGYILLLLAVAIGGLSAALSNPATNRLVLATYPPGRRGAITGLKQSGVQLGTLLAGIALPPLALAVGWRDALLLTGALAASGALLALLVVPRRAPSRKGTTDDDGDGDTTTVAVLCAFAALMGLGIASVTTYLPVYAVEQVEVTVTTAGLVTAVVGGLGIAARLFWGVTADRIHRPLRVLPWLGIGAMVGVGLLAGASVVGPWALWLGAGVFGATAMAWNGVAMLIAMTAVPPARAGWATGRVILWFYAGLVASPIPFGLLADRTDSYLVGWAGVTVAFFAASTSVVLRERRRRRP